MTEAHREVCGDLAECYKNVQMHSDIAEGLRADVAKSRRIGMGFEARLKESEAQRTSQIAAQAEKDDVVNQELYEAGCAVRAEGKAISSFLNKFPAAEALVVLFKQLMSLVHGASEVAIRKRLSLHDPSLVCKHELEQFLSEDLGIRGASMQIVSRALFGALDLERNGFIFKNVLCKRLDEPPSMKTVWLSELQAVWPDRWQEMVKSWVSESRSPSPPRPASSPNANNVEERSHSARTPASPASNQSVSPVKQRTMQMMKLSQVGNRSKAFTPPCTSSTAARHEVQSPTLPPPPRSVSAGGHRPGRWHEGAHY